MSRFSGSPEAADWLAPQGPREGLRHYVEVVRERIWLVIACVVIATGAAAAYATLATKTYEAQATLLVTPVDSGDPDLLGLGLIPSSSDPTRDVSTAASLVNSPSVAARAAEEIGGDPGELRQAVTAEPLAQSNVVAITAEADAPERAAEIANAFAEATIADRTARLHRQLDTLIPSLQARVDRLPVTEQSSQSGIAQRLAALESLRASDDPTIHVETLAEEPTGPSWPRPKLSVVVGAIVGLMVGLVIAFALEALDPQVRREEALRRIFRLPLLARIPSERRGRRTSSPLLVDDLSPSAREGYRMLRVAFDARQRRGRSHSVLVTSSGHSEGKSTTALNLATSLAAVGHSVILVEADLRRPSLRRGLGLPPSVGVAGVLMSEVDFEEALLDVPDTDGDLRLLLAEESAGYLADSPLAAGITDVIARAGELCDYVVVDAPPATEVSDVIPIAQAVDDVIVVARIGRSRTDRLEQLGELLARHGIRPVGIVVVGAERTRDSGYYAETTPARKARKRGRGSDFPAARS